MQNQKDLLTLSQASKWASEELKKNVTTSNISYLVQYGRITKYTDQGITKVSRNELIRYYESYLGTRELSWKAELGEDINWSLSFDYLKEADTTKHVHRLHPYKGKFIPQLVGYFLDNHIDEFKKEVYFQPGDVVLDPFCGSGTTLVQANELGLHAIGVDVSAFNALISNIKIGDHNLLDIQEQTHRITRELQEHFYSTKVPQFDAELTAELAKFNEAYFPSPEFKYKVQRGLINQDEYGKEYEATFLLRYYQLVKQYDMALLQDSSSSFLDKWYLQPIRDEINLISFRIEQIASLDTRRVVQLILSRTVRSCRATTHADLATLIDPVSATYYCSKHGKVCKPLFSMLSWWQRYCQDTLHRLLIFKRLRTETNQYCVVGDSQETDLFSRLEAEASTLGVIAKDKKIRGIFSSPPYVGLIDYHEQHAYAYELFGFPRQDSLEIGAMSRGQGREAREAYVQSIAKVLLNCRRFLADQHHIFLVANDKYHIYPRIAELAKMKIVNQFRRPVLNRTEKDKAAYSETIFHLQAI